MTPAATEQDRGLFEERRGKRDLRGALMRFSASLVIHILVFLLLALEIETHVEIVEAQVIPVDLELEAPPPPPEPVAAEPQPPNVVSPTDPHAKSDAKAGGGGVPEVGDANRLLKAPLGSETVSGQGQAESRGGAPLDATQKDQAEPTPPDRDKEISHLVPPAKKPDAPRKPRIAPPGPARQAVREKPDPKATDEEATVKLDDIHCGANAKMPTPAVGKRQIAQVLGALSDDQASAVHAKMQVVRDLRVSQRFLHVRAAAVHFDGEPENVWHTTFLPPGLTVQVGDQVELASGHLDPSSPCTYIPRLVIRVL